MDWTQFLGLIIAFIGIMLWFKSETNSLIREIQLEVREFHKEIKDFHGRLCALEEKSRGK